MKEVLRAVLPWVLGALLVVAVLWWVAWVTTPTPDVLPTVYSVL